MKKADNMDKLYLEVPTFARKNDAYEFIQEFLDNNSSINGSGSLHRYVNKEKNNYENGQKNQKKAIANLNNPASWKTMEALGCIRVSKYYDYINAQCTFVDYNIDVPESLNNYLLYENYISK